MAVLNLRGIPTELARMIKATAASEGKTLVEFATDVFERDIRRGGWTAARKVEGKSNGAIEQTEGIEGGKSGEVDGRDVCGAKVREGGGGTVGEDGDRDGGALAMEALRE